MSLIPVVVEDRAEIAIEHCRGGDVILIKSRFPLTVSFIRNKEKRFVVAIVQTGQYDRAAGACSEFITDQLGRRVVILPGARAKSAGVVPHSLEQRAVQLIRSTLGHQRHRGGAGISCARSVGFYTELLNRVQTRLNPLNPSSEPVHQRYAVLDDFERSDF